MDIRQMINLVESANLHLNGFVRLAQSCDTVEKFIKKTDGMDVLYRGHSDDAVGDNSFMTDWVGHAEGYIDDTGRVDAFAFNPGDVMFFDDQRFEEMRGAFSRLDNKAFVAAFKASLTGNRFASNIESGDGLKTAKKLISSKKPYSSFVTNPELNDAIIPLMQYYAREKHGKNIISFLGGDYGDWGGQNEFVVGDISKLVDLRKLYAQVRAEMTHTDSRGAE